MNPYETTKSTPASNWHRKVGHRSQLGGIETAVLDNGPGRGSRIAWIDTGTGLRYKVLLDRGMDIAEAFFGGYSLAWISQVGTVGPQHLASGLDWLSTFGGGLLTTCGLSHVGGPEEDAHGKRGLHGRISNEAAEVLSIVQPDPIMGETEMSISGIIMESTVFGPHLCLKRTIKGKLGEAKIQLIDQVVNRSNETQAHMLLYHINFGWPLVDEGASIVWKGNWRPREDTPNNPIFHQDNDFKTCPPPLEAHKGSGEDVAFIDAKPAGNGICTAGICNQSLGLGLKLSFKKDQLPWLTNWQHWGEHEYVTALEPGTHPPIGQAMAREDGSLLFLQPGESKYYELEMEVLTREEDLQGLLAINQSTT
ncbi:aldose 1-epimerase family protein [Pleomorphovibrio marinus]|uniref:aldose 1-epimerase family protein n=1 Tax=Pleomorphovibrio marinus TaxID=2164132 RepID=UPI000E0BD4B4|nr:aldose 1-epimerase family protein [Pleomorphovibrio marinus]